MLPRNHAELLASGSLHALRFQIVEWLRGAACESNNPS